MSFLLPDDDDNPFANAVSPFAAYTPPVQPSPQPDTQAQFDNPATDYGSPLPTPSGDVVGHTTGPYIQALAGGDGQQDAYGSSAAGLSGADAEIARPSLATAADDAASSPPSSSTAVFLPSEPVDAMRSSSPDAFAGGFQTSPERQRAFAPYRPPSPPALEPSDAFPSAETRASTDLSGASPPAPVVDKKAVEASLADLLGESEEVRLKEAFRKGAAGSSASAAASPTKSKSSESKKKDAQPAVVDDEDPFGALLKKRNKTKAAKGRVPPASATAPPVAAAAPSPVKAVASTTSASEAAAGPESPSVEPSSSAEPVAPPLPELVANDDQPGAGIKPETLALPPSEPSSAPGTPRAPTPPPKSSAVSPSPEASSSTAPTGPTTTEGSPRVAVSPLVTPTPPSFTISSASSAIESDDGVRPRTSFSSTPPPRVERSFSELTLDGQRAAQLGLGGGPDAGTGAGWGATPLEDDGGWGGEEEKLVSGGPPVEEEPESTPEPAPSAALSDPALDPPPVDKAFLAASKKAEQMFEIHIGDPTKVGLGATAHTVYTVTTLLRVPTEYGTQAREVAVLRRFSDFLWLYGALSASNPGVIVPPVPDKQSFGRFGDEFIETRRRDLQKFLSKTGQHPILQLDSVFTAFLTADNLTAEMKHYNARLKHDAAGAGAGGADKGYLASLASGVMGPKFVERDEWFDDRKGVLETLEGQLKALVKSVELVSKQRLDLSVSIHDFAESISSLAQGDLSRPMALALERFSDVLRRAKDKEEGNGRGDVAAFMGTADEYIRLIASVRHAFASRIKTYLSWQTLEADARRQRTALDKARRQGKVAAERVGQEIALVADAERRAKEAGAEYESVSRLVKNEYARFEDERVGDFKRMLEVYVEGMIHRQKALIAAYEDYHTSLVRLVQQSQPQPATPNTAKPASPPRPTASSQASNGGDSPERARVGGPPSPAAAPNPFAEDDARAHAPEGTLAGLPEENAWA